QMRLISSRPAWRSKRSAARQYTGRIAPTASARRLARNTVFHVATALSASQERPRGRRLRPTTARSAAMKARPPWDRLQALHDRMDALNAHYAELRQAGRLKEPTTPVSDQVLWLWVRPKTFVP